MLTRLVSNTMSDHDPRGGGPPAGGPRGGGPPAEGPGGGDRLGSGHPQKTIQSPNKLYKAPKTLYKATKDNTKPQQTILRLKKRTQSLQMLDKTMNIRQEPKILNKSNKKY